ncbi:MAG: sigma-70 family RNA polymerase sigma factor [Deltaproteobacteria bacterium]|nr:sigma-70 family RNA polymerase sigma factor [Deltaproteobacteria bacterium]
MDEPKERALVERIHQSRGATREEALGELLEALEPNVRGLCFRLTASHADAEDATQDTLLGIYRGMAHFRGESRVSTWAYRIAVRSATKVRARQRKHAATDEPVEDLAGAPAPEVFERDLRRALASLSVTHATVLGLFALDGMSHQEIAEVLNVPEGTIWSRLHTARRKLALAIDGDSGG